MYFTSVRWKSSLIKSVNIICQHVPYSSSLRTGCRFSKEKMKFVNFVFAKSQGVRTVLQTTNHWTNARLVCTCEYSFHAESKFGNENSKFFKLVEKKKFAKILTYSLYQSARRGLNYQICHDVHSEMRMKHWSIFFFFKESDNVTLDMKIDNKLLQIKNYHWNQVHIQEVFFFFFFFWGGAGCETPKNGPYGPNFLTKKPIFDPFCGKKVDLLADFGVPRPSCIPGYVWLILMCSKQWQHQCQHLGGGQRGTKTIFKGAKM